MASGWSRDLESRVSAWAAALFGIAWLATWIADAVLGSSPVDVASVARLDAAETERLASAFFDRLRTSFGLAGLASAAAWLLLRTRGLPARATWSWRLVVIGGALVAALWIGACWPPTTS